MKNSWAMHHPRRTTGTLGASATMRTPREPPTRPMTIHGRRMPSRDVVRSLILPKNGLPNMATREPIPVDQRQAVRRLLDPHQRVDLQRQGDQQGREEHQGGAHVRQRVQRDEAPSDPVATRCGSGRQCGLRLPTIGMRHATEAGSKPRGRPQECSRRMRRRMMPAPLLETKLYVPRPRRGLVPRPRLIERLDRGAASKLDARVRAGRLRQDDVARRVAGGRTGVADRRPIRRVAVARLRRQRSRGRSGPT